MYYQQSLLFVVWRIDSSFQLGSHSWLRFHESDTLALWWSFISLYQLKKIPWIIALALSHTHTQTHIMTVWTCFSPSLFLTAVSNDPLQQDSTDGGLLLCHHCARPDPGHALQAGQCCWLQQGHVLGVGTKVCVYIPSPCSPQTHTHILYTHRPLW